MFGIAVSRRGRPVVFLGTDTPLETLRETVVALHPSAVVLAVTRPEPLRGQREALRGLADEVRLLVCGAGAVPADVAAAGAEVLEGDPVQAARTVTA
jgi:methanogenic corrinoid protein MtbC1